MRKKEDAAKCKGTQEETYKTEAPDAPVTRIPEGSHYYNYYYPTTMVVFFFFLEC